MGTQTLTLGAFELTIVSGGRLMVDGGNLFGIIPKSMWEPVWPPDADNRMQMDTNCLLVRTPDSLGLIDTGYGNLASEKLRARMGLQPGHPLLSGLEALGISPGDLDWVILTHLHFDHVAGSAFREPDGTVRPAFPRARHYAQRREWDDATTNSPYFAGAYTPDHFLPIQHAGLLELIDQDFEVVPGIITRLTPGHTRGHQGVWITSEGRTAVYLGDLVPTTAHLKTLWTMAWDQYPLTVRQTKREVLTEMADRGHTAILGHDPRTAFTGLQLDERGDAMVAGPDASRIPGR